MGFGALGAFGAFRLDGLGFRGESLRVEKGLSYIIRPKTLQEQTGASEFGQCRSHHCIELQKPAPARRPSQAASGIRLCPV